MDLSFTCFDRDRELVILPGDLATLMVGVAARQGASHTAMVQAGLAVGAGSESAAHPYPFAIGAFNAAVAAALTHWRNP